MADVVVHRDGWCPELDLNADEITTVRFADEDLETVEVIALMSIGSGTRVRWTCDGTEPGEDAGWLIPVDGTDVREPPTSGATVVKLWASGPAKACVQRG